VTALPRTAPEYLGAGDRQDGARYIKTTTTTTTTPTTPNTTTTTTTLLAVSA